MRVWVLAALELIVAFAVARLILAAGRPAMTEHHHLPAIAWGWLDYAWIGLGGVAAGCWLLQRKTAAAVAAAAAIAVFAVSPAIRVLSSGSHLIAMVGLELVTVVFPLLVLAASPRVQARPGAQTWSRGWTAFGVVAALLYAGLLVVIHLPAVHDRGAGLGAAPLWVAFAALAVGVAYWFGVLGTAGRVPAAIRRRLLLSAQELAAFIGLVSLFGGWGAMAHTTPLGISAAWDQRLGGLVMMATCAAVTIPLLRRIK